MKLTAITKWEQSSFHGTTINTTPSSLLNLAKKNNLSYCDYNDGEDKTNFDFSFQAGEDLQFTVYDWKEYRPLNLESTYLFHIGGKDKNSTDKAKSLLIKLIK